MALQPGSISAQPAAETLSGAELALVEQAIGAVVAATQLTVGQGYRIVSLGTTNWQAVGAGASAAAGTVFSCESAGTGTGTAQRIDARRLTVQAIAALAGVAAAIQAHEAAADPHPSYTTAAELATALQPYLSSTAAAAAYQPLDADLTALAAVAGQTSYGRAFLALLDQAGARNYIGVGQSDTLTLAGLTLTGLAALPHIHGNLAGSLYAHVKNVSGGALAAGTPVRVTGAVGDTETLEVVAADAASLATMPALLVLSETLAANGSGHAVLAGEITGINTSAGASGAPVWVAPGGGWTTTRPASNAQQVATIGRSHATTGTLLIRVWPVEDPAVSQADAEAGTSTTAGIWSPARWRQAAVAWFASITSANGRELIGGTYAQMRGFLGLGSAAVAAASDFAAAAHSHSLVTTSAAGFALPTGFSSLTYAATVNLDMAVLDGKTVTLSLTGNVIFTTSNLANGRTCGIRIICDASSRTIGFPVGWTFISPKPSSMSASKTAKLALEFYGSSDADCVAGIAIQP